MIVGAGAFQIIWMHQSHTRAPLRKGRPARNRGVGPRTGDAPPVPSDGHVQQQQQQQVQRHVADRHPDLVAQRAGRYGRRVLGRQRAAAEDERRTSGGNPSLESGVGIGGVHCGQGTGGDGQAEGAALCDPSTL